MATTDTPARPAIGVASESSILSIHGILYASISDRDATPRSRIDTSDEKASNSVPSILTSRKPNLTHTAIRNGGRNTLNPEAAARPSPVDAAMSAWNGSMVYA